jgi:hypothetical protein
MPTRSLLRCTHSMIHGFLKLAFAAPTFDPIVCTVLRDLDHVLRPMVRLSTEGPSVPVYC